MQFHATLYILPLVVSTVIAALVAFYVWERRATVSGTVALALLALACAVWSLGYALEIAGAGLQTKILWGQMQYLGIVAVPLLWVIFTYSYTSQGTRMTRRTVVLLSIIPAITLLLAFTTQYHQLIWQDVHIRWVGTFSALAVTHGFWFWVYWIYSYFLVLIGTVYILRSLNRTKGLFRRQNIILLIAVL
ncbi:MAG: histidine kinase N-terminal 7TM domain-containing protein, partial [Bacteroidota bacterium]